MKTLNLVMFDDTISGTVATWFSPVTHSDELGKHDQIAIQADVAEVAGTTTLNVQVEHSADGQYWLPVAPGFPEISTTVLANTSYFGYEHGLIPVLLGFLRLKVSLSGTKPACRLKLAVTCRDH